MLPARRRHARERRPPRPKIAEGLVRDGRSRDDLTLARTLGISEKRLLGWEPTETHRGYDADGNQVPIADAFEVVVTRETEWDDLQRSRMQALAIFEAGLHSCGWHTSLTTDPRVDFAIVDEPQCQVCAATARYRRITDHADTMVRRQIGEHPASPDPADGRRTSVQLKS